LRKAGIKTTVAAGTLTVPRRQFSSTSDYKSMNVNQKPLKFCIGGAALMAMFTILNISCSRTPNPAMAADLRPADGVPVAVARAARADLSRNLAVAAEFRAFQEIDVHAKVAGYVKSIVVDAGDRVQQGQILATLEIPEMQAEVAESEAAVRRNEEEINRAQGELARANSVHQTVHLAYTRLESAVKTMPKLVAQQDIDDAQGRDSVAEAQIDSAKAALAAARQQLDVSKAALDKSKSMSDYARITAPFAGVVTKRYADTGAMIPAGTSSSTSLPLVRLSQNSTLRLVIPVPESAVPKIHLRTPVEVHVPVLNKSFPGVVARFADRLDLNTRTMETEIDVRNPNLELMPGMYAEASISLEQSKEALAIPIQALKKKGDATTVLCVTPDNTIEERSVTVGLQTPDLIAVRSGLSAGDLIVLGTSGQLHPGQKVQPKITEVKPIREES
jgi:RND family efflux transporter MFP subunit